MKLRISDRKGSFRKKKQKGTSGWRELVYLSFFVLLLSGCGGAAAGQASGAAESEMVVSETAAATAAASSVYESGIGFSAAPETQLGTGVLETGTADDAAKVRSEDRETSEVQDTSIARKLIRNVSIDAETNQFDSALADVQARIAAIDGYTEQFDSYSPSGDSTAEMRNAYIRARIPADRLDEFLNTALQGLHVTNRSETTQDVTLQYTDIDARERALRVEQERLMELLAEAQSADSLIALEQRLSEIRYEIESLTSQLRVYDNQVQYSTVDIHLYEVRTVSAAADDGFAEQLRSGFQKNLGSMGIFLRNAALFVLTSLPVILPVAVILILVYSISKWVKRRIHRSAVRQENTPDASRTAQGCDPKMNEKDSSGKHAADDKAGKTGIHRG